MGNTTYGKKGEYFSIIMTMVMVGIVLSVGFFILSNVYIIIAMAFTATFVETFISELDDNLLVPIFASLTGQILSFFI